MPVAFGVIGGDVAVELVVPGVRVAGLGKPVVPGIWVPIELEQVVAGGTAAAICAGLQEKNVTCPVGAVPGGVVVLTVAVSLHEPPIVGVVPDVCSGVVVIGGVGQLEKGPGPTRSDKSLV